MKTTIPTWYVDTRSELTTYMDNALKQNFEAYRVRIQCQCPIHNHRNGLLIINQDNQVIAKVIRCKTCKKGGAI